MTLQGRQGFSKVSPIGVPHHPLRDDGNYSAVAKCDMDVAKHIAGPAWLGGSRDPSEGIV
jgi:hypothetical protein